MDLILLILALRLVPADVTSIRMQFNDAAVIQATKHADGGWRVPHRGQIVCGLPSIKEADAYTVDGLQVKGSGRRIEEADVYTVDGLQVKLKSGANEHTFDLAKLADVDEKTEWASLKEAKALGGAIRVERDKDTLLLERAAPQGNLTQKLVVSWARDPT